MRRDMEATSAEDCATAAILCRPRPDHRSDPDAADRRNPDHLRHVLVSPRVFRHQHRDVRPHRRSCLGLPSLRDLPSGAIVLSSERRVARLRPGDRLGAPGAVDHRHEPARIGHVARRLGRVRRRPLAAVLLLRHRRQPGADAQPLSRSASSMAIDLLGAALGCLGALALLNLVSGPSAVLWIAVLIAAGGLFFAGRASGMFLPVDRWPPGSSGTAASCLAGLGRPRRRQQRDRRHPADDREGQCRAAGDDRLREMELVLAHHGRPSREDATGALGAVPPLCRRSRSSSAG